MADDKADSLQKTREIVSVVFKDGRLGEIIFDPARQPPLQFVFCKDGIVSPILDHCPLANGITAIPPADKHGLLEKRVVLLPSCAAEYGSQTELLTEMVAFVHRYADVPPLWEELIAHYALMTWLYDRFTAVPYLRFLGEPGSGKTRCLQVAGHLCYKAIIGGGSTTASPLFRLLEVYHGTFVIDEADYKHSDLSVEIIKILNCGYMRGMPVLRSEKDGDGYDPRAFDVFGPKILTTRKEFADRALETRCLTLRTGDRKVRPDIPRQLPGRFYSEALPLRNKLLRWRFENFFRIQAMNPSCSPWSLGSHRSARRSGRCRPMTDSAVGWCSSWAIRRKSTRGATSGHRRRSDSPIARECQQMARHLDRKGCL